MRLPLNRIQRAARRESFETLLAAIQTGHLGYEEKQRMRGRIMTQVLTGRITPVENRMLLTALEGRSHGTKRR
jgi:hypothetical protein